MAETQSVPTVIDVARFELPLPEWLSPPFSSGVQAKSSDGPPSIEQTIFSYV